MWSLSSATLLLLVLMPTALRAETAGQVDPSFAASLGLLGSVERVYSQSDGSVIVIGSFPRRILRLNPNGSLDASFNPGTDDSTYYRRINSLVVQSDGKILIWGNFTTFNGVGQDRIARLNANGSVDASFNPGAGAYTSIDSLVVQGDGKILVAGDFTSFNGVDRNGIARLNANGSVDASFNPDADGSIYSLVVQGDGRTLLGGNFTHVDGTIRNYIARLDTSGHLDQKFVPGQSPVTINALVSQTDSSVIIGGDFSLTVGAVANALARLDSAGVPDASFTSEFEASETVQALSLQADGDLLVAAMTTEESAALSSLSAQAPGQPHAQSKVHNTLHRCSKVNGKFIANFSASTDGTTLQVVALPGNLSLIGGTFTQVNGQAQANLARLLADGSLDASFVGTADGSVLALFRQGDGKIIVGGDFAGVDGTTRTRVARLNADGSLDFNFDPKAGPDGPVNAVRTLANGKVLIGGSFTKVNGTARGGVAQLNADGSLDLSFNPGSLAHTSDIEFPPRRTAAAGRTVTKASVMSLDVQSADGKIILGGLFDALAGTARHNVLRLTADGKLDASFDPGSGPDAAVKALKIQKGNGRTLIGGAFASVENLERPGVARLLGDKDATPVVPTVSFVIPGATNGSQTTQMLEGGPLLKLKVVRSGTDSSKSLAVQYKTSGSNVPGVDYKALSGKVTIPKGANSAKISVRALDDGAKDGNKTLTLKLTPATGGSYQLGTPAQAKIRIIDAQGLE